MADAAAITPITEWPAYEINPNGGDPVTQDLNAPYDKGDLCWLLVSTVICWQITPAIGFLYAGLTPRRSSSLTQIFQSLFLAAACGIQFWAYGYSLYMSHSASPAWGDLSLAGLQNVMAYPSQANTGIPDILYAAFGMTFVTATAMILAGALLERGRLGPSLVFLLCWTTFVYYVLAYWEWNPSGWLYQLGVYDFAGSGPVHIASGFGALAWSLMLGPRIRPNDDGDSSSGLDTTTPATAGDIMATDSSGSTADEQRQATTAGGHEKAATAAPASSSSPLEPARMPNADFNSQSYSDDFRTHHLRPHSPIMVAFGTVFIWFGWFAFNGASTANLSIRSIYVVVNTNLAACAGGLGWSALEYLHSWLGARRREEHRDHDEDSTIEGSGPASRRSGGKGRSRNGKTPRGQFSITGFCSGIISGLVGITPAAGYIPVATAPVIGVLTAASSFYVVRHKHRISLMGARLDDGLDIFAIHGVGGVVGDVLTGFFARTFVPALDGASGDAYAGGWWEGNWAQMGYQLAAALTCAAWSFVVSVALLWIIGRVPGMSLRVDREVELAGLDGWYLSDAGYDNAREEWEMMGFRDGGKQNARRYVLQAYEGVPVPVDAAISQNGEVGIKGNGEVKRD